MIEESGSGAGSGSVPRTNEAGRLKNIRFRIRNTALKTTLLIWVMLEVAAPVHVHDEREPGRSFGGGAELQLEPRGNQVRWQGLLPQGHQV
jgi:hypothetical protein